MSKKSAIKSSVPSTAAAPAAASPNPIPTTVSAPPKGWVAPERLGKKGRRPNNGLSIAAVDLAGELQEKGTALAAELGPNVVEPSQVATALVNAKGWDGVEAQASTFHTYARAQRGASWNGALTLLAGMKLGVRYALARDASFADRFPEVAKAFAPGRRSKKKAADGAATAPTPKKKAPVATESTAPASPTPASQPATPETAPTT
jgi:hypothetical protein